MKNPWFDIPLLDYEGHMALPNVGQALLLSDVFADALNKFSPCSVAILGCAGGNGLDRISSKATKRVVCVDINPDYVQQVFTRFVRQFPHIELFVGDVQTEVFPFAPVELVFSGLLFEYVDTETLLGKIRAMLCPGGILLTVVQLPCTTVPEITPSPFTSLSTLSSVMHLVSPELLRELAVKNYYREIEAQTKVAAGGKGFRIQVFRQEGHSHRSQWTPENGRG